MALDGRPGHVAYELPRCNRAPESRAEPTDRPDLPPAGASERQRGADWATVS
jgi:hypothetical protein